MNKWKYDTREWEDFADFMVGTAWVMLLVFVGAGLAVMTMQALGYLRF
jgi:hypothetical protein